MPGTKEIRILLVDDHLLSRLGLRAILDRTEDLKVIGEAENGEQALSKVDELKPDLVLMDVGMPLMDGIECSKRLREKYPTLAIVMLTAHDQEYDIFASLAAGAGGYCLKNVEPERMYSAIRSVYAGDIWLDATIASKVLKMYNAGNVPAPPEPIKAKDLLEPLSPREMEVLSLLVEGCSNQAIADRLMISIATAKTHVRNILNKLAVDDRTQAAVQAMRRGLV